MVVAIETEHTQLNSIERSNFMCGACTLSGCVVEKKRAFVLLFRRAVVTMKLFIESVV